MNSSWDSTKENSAYHFDPTCRDSRWDTVIGLGRFAGNWKQEVDDVIAQAKPATWETRGYKGEGYQVPRSDLAAEEYDLERVGVDPKIVITHLHWNLAPIFQKMSDLFALDDAMNRIHVQKPGEVWHLHIDKLQKWCPDNPERVLRVFIQLTDWQPGQFWEYGTYHWNQWRAGDISTFDWPNVPHSTANAGHHPRVTLQVTGVRTEQTDSFLQDLKNSTQWAI
jgi:hypothetical protein